MAHMNIERHCEAKQMVLKEHKVLGAGFARQI
jgi:hypothetical protein